MNVLKSVSLALLALSCAALTIFHHGWADYDQTKVLDYTGTIEQSSYENPHVTAKVKAKNQSWTVFLAPTSRMQARGVTADMVKKGTSVRIVGYPHKEVKDEMRAERIFIDGKKYELR